MSVPVKPGWRVVSAAAGSVAALLLACGAWYGYSEVMAQPVQRVMFAGDVERLEPVEVAKLEQALLAAPSASMDAMRTAARQVPWVREATARRVFPDAVEIRFAAHTAFARWNDGRLVSSAGEVFSAPAAADLPRLSGPEGSAARMVQEYPLVAAALAPLGSTVSELRLTPRGGWHATLASGLAIALGRADWRPRAARFVAAWPKLAPEARAWAYADLRYPGGFAMNRGKP